MAIMSTLGDAFANYFNMLQQANEVYNTPLSDTEEAQYLQWKDEQQRTDDAEYDLRGHFKKFVLGGAGIGDEYGAYAKEAAEAARKAGSLADRQAMLREKAGSLAAQEAQAAGAEASLSDYSAEGATAKEAQMANMAGLVGGILGGSSKQGATRTSTLAATAKNPTAKPLGSVPAPVADQVAEFMKPLNENFSNQSLYYSPEFGLDPFKYYDTGAT